MMCLKGSFTYSRQSAVNFVVMSGCFGERPHTQQISIATQEWEHHSSEGCLAYIDHRRFENCVKAVGGLLKTSPGVCVCVWPRDSARSKKRRKERRGSRTEGARKTCLSSQPPLPFRAVGSSYYIGPETWNTKLNTCLF